MENTDNIIEIRNLTKIFKTKNLEVTALSDINLDIKRGEIFGIIGMSGAGKSTLVRCINLLEIPTSGSVIFDDVDLTKISPEILRHERRKMGMIFQQFNLLMQRTALENICFPLEISGVKKADAIKRAEELLEIVDLTDRKNNYPSQLSGGQKQRVAIARALATNPKVLLCDEATSALDPKTTRGVLSLLKEINKKLGITVIIITHEMSVIEEICQKVAIIADNKIAEVSTVEEIFQRPKTDIAKQFVFPDGKRKIRFENTKNACRIVFDGSSSFEPVVANMILTFKEPVNIMFADTKDIDGKAFGQIVLQLPNNDEKAEKMIRYLRNEGILVEEVDTYVRVDE